jgi:hypothetical protein
MLVFPFLIVNKNTNNLLNGQVRKKSDIPLTKLSASSLTEKANPFYVTGFCDAESPSRSWLRHQKLVVFGTNLQSTVGEKFTRKELAMVRLAPYPRDVIVGLILSDR